MDKMKSRLRAIREYQDIHGGKKQQEVSIASEYIDGFDLYAVSYFILSVIGMTDHPVAEVLLNVIEISDYADQITDDLIYTGYGSESKESI